jgi:hypothetical protein
MIYSHKLDIGQGMSEREVLAVHAEIKATQQQFGLSYKDSAHRLYLAEVARLREIDKAHKGLVAIRQRIDKLVDHELVPPMRKMDKEKGKESP